MAKFGPFRVSYMRPANIDGALPDKKEGWVMVEVDEAWLAGQLGPRALRSKGGVARESSGAVIVRVVK